MIKLLTSTLPTAHLSSMMGQLGLYQHAKYVKPRLEEGYCTDDNARAVQVLVEWQYFNLPSDGKIVSVYLERCWQFMVEAQTPEGYFRNFRSDQGVWLDDRGTEDTQARVARALSTCIRYGSSVAARRQAREMLDRLLPHLLQLSHPRGIAEAVLGLADLADHNNSHKVLSSLWERLWERWQGSFDKDWPWPDEQLTYANALLPHGLLAGASALGLLQNADTQKTIQKSVDFLVNLTCRQGYFQPIGTSGWYSRNEAMTLYDQQPTEAHTMLDLLQAYTSLADIKLPEETLIAPYAWFWGKNSRAAVMIDFKRGACYDGLTPRGVNRNRGAESLLAYLRSELLITNLNSRAVPVVSERFEHFFGQVQYSPDNTSVSGSPE